MTSKHTPKTPTKTTERTVNAGDVHTSAKNRTPLAQGLLNTAMEETTGSNTGPEPMECDQPSDATPTLSPVVVSQGDQAQVSTTPTGSTNGRPLPVPGGAVRVPGGSGQPHHSGPSVHGASRPPNDSGSGAFGSSGQTHQAPTQHNQDQRNNLGSQGYQQFKEKAGQVGPQGGYNGGPPHGSQGYFPEDAGHSHHGGYHPDDFQYRHRDRMQDQMDVQLQRPLQASKQMAYQVFANVITAIEELEHRECTKNKKKGTPVPERSEAFIPDQSFKNDQDVVAGVEAQLVVFQSHMGFCPKEISEQIKVEMIDTTLTWAAARQDIKLPAGKVDQYALNLLEILYDGATTQTFSILKKSWRLLSRSELMSGFSKIMRGQAKGMQLDREFTENPAKEAEALPIRQGKHITDGILRLMGIAKKQKKTNLVKQFEQHLESISCAR